MVKIRNFKKKFKANYSLGGSKAMKSTKKGMLKKYAKKKKYMKKLKYKQKGILKFKNKINVKDKIKKYVGQGLGQSVKIKKYSKKNYKKIQKKVKGITKNILKVKVDYQLGVNEGFAFYNGADFTSKDIFNEYYGVQGDRLIEMYKRQLYENVFTRASDNQNVPNDLRDTQLKMIDTKIIIDNYTSKGNIAILSFYKPYYICHQTTQAFKFVFSQEEFNSRFWTSIAQGASYVYSITTNGVLDAFSVRIGNFRAIKFIDNALNLQDVIAVLKRQCGMPLGLAIADINQLKESAIASLAIAVDVTDGQGGRRIDYRVTSVYSDWPKQVAGGTAGLLVRRFEEMLNLQVNDHIQWSNYNADIQVLSAHVRAAVVDGTDHPVLNQFGAMFQGLKDEQKQMTIGLLADILSFATSTTRNQAIPLFLQEYVTRNNNVERTYFTQFEEMIKEGMVGIRSLKDSQETQYKPQLMGNLHYLVNFAFPANVSIHQLSAINLVPHVAYLKLIRSNQNLIKTFTPEFFEFVKRHLKPMLPIYPFTMG